MRLLDVCGYWRRHPCGRRVGFLVEVYPIRSLKLELEIQFLSELPQVVDQLIGSLVSIVSVFGERAADDLL